ncbi:MAG: serine hydrolase domain-containing protein [Promethearchaeota archaeon]|jgi:CubicO group peptidase (beta-lactamase class C family)
MMIGGIRGNPEEVGIDKTGLNNVLKTLEDQVTEGFHTGAQLHISRKGQTVLDVAVGEAKPGIQMQIDSILALWSSGKPWTSVAIAQLWERGKLGINQTVQSIIPEFKNGKETCTIKHLLIHAGGFPMLLYPKWLTATWEEIIIDICNGTAEYKPGTQCGYHPRASWIILGEIIRRIDGRRIDDYLKEEIFDSLGMDSSYLGMTKERVKKLGDRLALKDTPDEAEKMHLWINNFEGRIYPGTNGYSTANDMGKFYRALWNGGEWEGNRILKKDTVKYFTATHRMGIADLTFSTPLLQIAPDFGLGFAKGKSNSIVCSRDAFGHGGRSSCVNFCDPQVDLVVNFNSNTMLGLEQNMRRMIAIISKIYESCRYKF